MSVSARLLSGFDDPSLAGGGWERLAREGPSAVPFLTAAWQRAWWESFGRGRLLLAAAESDGKLAALAPLFADGGMAFFVGSGGSDYLDFLGHAGADQLAAMLDVARAAVDGFVGFRFYHVLDGSPTAERLHQVAPRLGLVSVEEEGHVAPYVALGAAGTGAAERPTPVRRARWLAREGTLAVEHLSRAEEIAPHLEAFFAQHVARWEGTPSPSLFLDPAQRRFYHRLVALAAPAGLLRFTRLVWNGRPIAFHFGTVHAGRWLWYKPSFDPEMRRHSPGAVLLREILLRAAEEGLEELDLGLGDEPFKQRFATARRRLRTWGLYPPEALR